MNIQQWITPLLKMAQKQNYFNMFGTKRKSNGMWWASMIGIGISIIALVAKFGNDKGQKSQPVNTAQNLVNNIKKSPVVDIQKFLTMQDKSVLAEFSNEITPKEAPKNVPNPNHNPQQ